MNRKNRLKALERLAQTSPITPQGASDAATITKVTPSTPSIDLDGLFGQINLLGGWDASRVIYIRRILSKLDRATFAATNGKVSLKFLWPTFPDGIESTYTSPAGDLIKLLRKVYQQFLNRGTKYTKPLSSDEVRQRISVLLNAPEMAKLSQINPSGPIGKAGISLDSIRQDLSSMMPAASTN